MIASRRSPRDRLRRHHQPFLPPPSRLRQAAPRDPPFQADMTSPGAPFLAAFGAFADGRVPGTDLSNRQRPLCPRPPPHPPRPPQCPWPPSPSLSLSSHPYAPLFLPPLCPPHPPRARPHPLLSCPAPTHLPHLRCPRAPPLPPRRPTHALPHSQPLPPHPPLPLLPPQACLHRTGTKLTRSR